MTTALLIAASVLAGLIVLGVLAEVACRLWFRRFAHVYIWPPYYHVEMDMDREILPNLTPHARFQANSLGTRGDEPPPRSAKAFRILACHLSIRTLTFLDLVSKAVDTVLHRCNLVAEMCD